MNPSLIRHGWWSIVLLIAASAAAGGVVRAEPAANAVVTIHPDRTGPAIPPDFLGLSCEKKILSRACFQPDNVVLRNILRNLGGGVLRVGANEVDSTFWSRTDTTPIASMDENRYSEQPSTIGPRSLDNLYTFVREAGWRVIHGVNLGANDPTMAADEAAYALEAGGPSVLAIEIGNEPNLYPKSATRPGIRPATYGYAEYRREFQAYVDAIRGRNPSAPLTGPATTRICKWFPDFVAEFQPQMTLVTSHLYLLSAKETDPAAPRFASIANLLTRRAEPEWLPQLEASKAAGIPFRLGECNTASGGGSRGVSDTFASALWAVDFLFEVAQRGGAGVNMHGGFTPGNYSPICYLKKESRYEPSPLYYGMLLFHEAARGRVVDMDCRSAANVSAHAIIDEDRVLRLVIINKETTRPVLATVATGRAGPRAEVVWLAAPSVTATAGVMLAGRSVAPDGTWSPQPGEAVACVDGQCEVSLPGASAALVTIK